MPLNFGIGVEGFDAFRADLKAAGKDAVKELARESKKLSEDIAQRARDRANALGSTAAHVADAIKSVQSSTGVYIRLDGAAFPEAWGAEFGGRRRPTTQQFQPFLGRQGYFLYPTVEALSTDDEVDRRFGDLMESLLTKHGA